MHMPLITDTRVIASLDAGEAWNNYVQAANEISGLRDGELRRTFEEYLYAEVAKQSLAVYFERLEEVLGQQ